MLSNFYTSTSININTDTYSSLRLGTTNHSNLASSATLARKESSIMASSRALQVLSISTALLASGGIASLSLFSIPLLKSQPASRSLPLTRWLFSRGSHIFPTAALFSSSGFAYLAYSALPPASRSFAGLMKYAAKGKVGLYAAAAALTISIAPFTHFMLSTNFKLIKMNEALGGTRSAASAVYREEKYEQQMAGEWPRGADESVNGDDDVSQWWDWSGPQERTRRESSKSQDQEVRGLLEEFGRMNGVRAGLMGVGGLVGLFGALM
ncbi:hypothetical protein HBH56_243780 [Parastagonospora nodorum]|nr:hypothetical protein HBH56_243780 [Parastagonospora nodorum]KAH3924087.1 hypothetical protein HBH54_198520 [Parastagonospora nodorum]KAH3944478.1 hypothetical protein HBH53_155030 [Parastagonospora nodorum]KAH3956558.1 hypothetical protein HBH51_239460 [Parastagonospora nodorum]KAH3964847.1 hypothetical protein HBH52_210710 [Parastagonospora nodorum]